MPKLKFLPSTSTDVVAYRVRIRPANTPAALDAPFEDVPLAAIEPADAQGFVRLDLSLLTQMQGVDGRVDIHLTAIDDAVPVNESDFLEVDNEDFDFSPPEAPTDGSVER